MAEIIGIAAIYPLTLSVWVPLTCFVKTPLKIHQVQACPLSALSLLNPIEIIFVNIYDVYMSAFLLVKNIMFDADSMSFIEHPYIKPH